MINRLIDDYYWNELEEIIHHSLSNRRVYIAKSDDYLTNKKIIDIDTLLRIIKGGMNIRGRTLYPDESINSKGQELRKWTATQVVRYINKDLTILRNFFLEYIESWTLNLSFEWEEGRAESVCNHFRQEKNLNILFLVWFETYYREKWNGDIDLLLTSLSHEKAPFYEHTEAQYYNSKRNVFEKNKTDF